MNHTHAPIHRGRQAPVPWDLKHSSVSKMEPPHASWGSTQIIYLDVFVAIEVMQSWKNTYPVLLYTNAIYKSNHFDMPWFLHPNYETARWCQWSFRFQSLEDIYTCTKNVFASLWDPTFLNPEGNVFFTYSGVFPAAMSAFWSNNNEPQNFMALTFE